MNVVFIVPTGIGAEVGGHSGDANPAFKLIASVCDLAITHPNVVNAADINEMPENSWYVEGSILDRFLEGTTKLKKSNGNRILLAVNRPVKNETINAANSAGKTIGCHIQLIELDTELKLEATLTDKGASGNVFGWMELIEQVSHYDYDALALATPIDVSTEVALNYFKNGGINPWGGVEAVASRLIATAINKPTAHAPTQTGNEEVETYTEVVDPRTASEMISTCYIHCVFKGLHKAPRPSNTGLSVEDIDCLVTPLNCYGRPHKACEKAGIPIIGVRENGTCLIDRALGAIIVDNYMEAVGMIQLLKTGMTEYSVRPLHAPTTVKGRDYIAKTKN